MEIEGRQVFVKRVPLTDIELQPEHLRPTAYLFGLPLFHQYGAGSAGFGARRELAAHIMTTGWVLKNEYAGFPLLYHWRVLPDCPPAGFADEFGGVDGAVAHGDGSPAVRRRQEAIGRSSFSLVLFLEHVPQTLARRLLQRRDTAQPDAPGASSFRWVEGELLRGTEFMSAHGLVHFDTHFANLLSDGRQVYFADFGLALSRESELSAAGADFLTARPPRGRGPAARSGETAPPSPLAGPGWEAVPARRVEGSPAGNVEGSGPPGRIRRVRGRAAVAAPGGGTGPRGAEEARPPAGRLVPHQ
ncbi:hypothetical protein SAMN05421773_10719 [Streptomyces aidingensis]|uniref:Protein kinase domain-containing protein n=1 Tax=Streptomyces aidingensis TaxID=910347 RepID=A0A1I1MR23_9ACTN|nr:hypothetical protein SAMN05421773_10719 [Streptomyces aidingensis]